MDVLAVFLAALATALATGLGALPFLFVHAPRASWLGMANALAAGCMLGAACGLSYEGMGFGAGRTIVGALAGVAVVALVNRVLEGKRDLRLGAVHGAAAPTALLIVGVMTVHSFAEGVGVGVAFGDGKALGILIAIAIAVHNIPEGLAISLVLLPRGSSIRAAAGWSVFSSLPQPLMAVPAFLFVEAFSGFLPLGLGFATGAMVWLVVADLIPEALRTAQLSRVAAVVIASAASMLAFQLLLL
jgi:zinc transporter ZupT